MLKIDISLHFGIKTKLNNNIFNYYQNYFLCHVIIDQAFDIFICYVLLMETMHFEMINSL